MQLQLLEKKLALETKNIDLCSCKAKGHHKTAR